MIKDKDFKGYIHDVGGPTANFRHPSCQKQLTKGVCMNRQCLFPKPCKNLTVDHKDYLKLLRKLRALPGVKKVFVRSGIRFDYLLEDPDDSFFRELCQYHVSGQLKVAPEHISDNVLKYMGKPPVAVYDRFKDKYRKINEKIGKKQYLVPYLMSSHPGSTLKDAIALAEYLRDLGYMPEQVQDFTRHRRPYRPVCTIRDWIRRPWNRSMWRTIRMKKPCSVPSSSIEIQRIMIWSMKHLRKNIGKI